MIDEDEQALRDARDLLDGLDDVADPGPAYWAAFPGRVRARLPARPEANVWRFAPRLALAASLALVVAVAALGPRVEVTAESGIGPEDPLLAAFAPAPVDDWAALAGLSASEVDDLEERLLAGAKPARTPPPRPTPSPTPRPSTSRHSAPAVEEPAPLDESLDGIESLPADRFDELLNRLDAMKT